MNEKLKRTNPAFNNSSGGDSDKDRIRMLSFLKGSTIVSGVNSYYKILARELLRCGHYVTTVIVGDASGQILDVLGSDIGNVEFLSMQDNRYRSMLNLFIKSKPSVVLNHYSEYGLQGTAVARYNGEKFHNIYVCHADTEDHYGIISRYRPLIDRVIAVNSICSYEVGKRFPEKYSDPFILPAGVDLPGHPVKIPQSGPLVLVYSGRMEQRQKRVFDFIPLVETLDSLGFQYQLHLVGDGSDIRDLQAHLTRKTVCFHGRLRPEDMKQLFSRSHILIMLSEFEGTSVSLLEAMGHGLVPVVTRVRGIEDVIEHEKNGLLFSIGKIDEAAKLLLMLDTDRNFAANLGTQARQTVAENFSSQHITSAFLKYIHHIGIPGDVPRENSKGFLNGGHFGPLDKPYLPNFPAYCWRQLTASPPIQSVIKQLADLKPSNIIHKNISSSKHPK